MTRRSLIALLCTTPALAQQTLPEDTQLRVEELFDKNWMKYKYAKMGCPIPDGKTAYTYADCVFPPGNDRGAFLRARELAKDVFGLRER